MHPIARSHLYKQANTYPLTLKRRAYLPYYSAPVGVRGIVINPSVCESVSAIFVNENENGEKRENNEFVNEN